MSETVTLVATSGLFAGMAVWFSTGRRPLRVIGEWFIRVDHNLACIPGAVKAGWEWYGVLKQRRMR